MAADRAAGIVRSWEANAIVWTDAVRSRAIESRRLVTDGAIVRAVLDTGARRVLDVGCGEGWLARVLTDAGCDVTGFDASRALIDRAADSVAAARFLALDYTSFAADPHACGTGFDAAVCNFSLLDEEIAFLLRALTAAVRPQGRLLIQTLHPAAAGPPYADGWREERFDGMPGTWEPMPWYFRTIGGWVSAVHAAGWRIERLIEPVQPEGSLPASLIIDAQLP